MSSRDRVSSPAPRQPKAPGGEKGEKPKEGTKDVVRTPSRVYEFGGNIGTFVWIFFIPAAVYYSYGLNVVKHGNPVVPDRAFWNELIWGLPEGIAIRPTAKGLLILVSWTLLQLGFQQFMPGKMELGVPLKSGRRLDYKMNGWNSWWATWVLVAVALWFDLVDPTVLYRNFGSMMTWAVILSFALALYLYVHFGLLWRRWINSPEFEEDWGVFKLTDFFHDFWMGTARNPRIFHFLPWPVDLKFFFEARPGLILWILINYSNIAAMYQGCSVGGNKVVCAAHGDWSRVPLAMWIVSSCHTYYIAHYFFSEVFILTTMDIRHDPFGFMLAYGDYGFLPWMYTASFTGYLASVVPRYEGNFYLDLVCIGGFILSMTIFRLSNLQKHNFRTYASEHGNDPTGYKIWGKPATWIKTKEGSLLLTSGWWGLCRHPNYLPDLMMCAFWWLNCTAHPTLPLVPLGYVIYFWMMDIHRFFRDERRLKEKYKDDWDKYVKAVPYCLVPGIL